MDFNVITQADQAAFELEKAKRALEAAKTQLEAAKAAYEEAMARAEENGIPKAKLKKLVDERVQALFDNGLVAGGGGARDASKAERPKRAKKSAETAAKPEEEAVETAFESDVEPAAEA